MWPWALIDCAGSNGSLTPISRTFSGMSWAMPSAPADDTDRGSKSDSARTWAASSSADTFHRWAAAANMG